MSVALELDARHDAGADADGIAARGIACNEDLVLQQGRVAKLERRDLVPKRRIVHMQQRKIAFEEGKEKGGGGGGSK